MQSPRGVGEQGRAEPDYLSRNGSRKPRSALLQSQKEQTSLHHHKNAGLPGDDASSDWQREAEGSQD